MVIFGKEAFFGVLFGKEIYGKFRVFRERSKEKAFLYRFSIFVDVYGC